MKLVNLKPPQCLQMGLIVETTALTRAAKRHMVSFKASDRLMIEVA